MTPREGGAVEAGDLEEAEALLLLEVLEGVGGEAGRDDDFEEEVGEGLGGGEVEGAVDSDDAAERYADARDRSILAAARQAAEQATDEAASAWDPNDSKRRHTQLVAGAAWQCLDLELNNKRWPFWVETVNALECDDIPGRTREAAEALHLSLFRDIFGNPFHPVAIDAAWLTWNNATVPAIARHIYDDRAFHELPLLADALEDAGCTDADLLAHCRGLGPHVRGCWVVDLLLGKT